MNKFKNEKGEIGVVYSPGFGAGWSTWEDSEHRDFLIMDKGIVSAVLNKDYQLAIDLAKAKVPHFYTGGAEDLVVEWIREGEQFEITEYDGNETLSIIGG